MMILIPKTMMNWMIDGALTCNATSTGSESGRQSDARGPTTFVLGSPGAEKARESEFRIQSAGPVLWLNSPLAVHRMKLNALPVLRRIN